MNCRICKSPNIEEVFSLGSLPLANNLADAPNAPCERFPLDLVFCMECCCLSLKETVPPEKMFSSYLYLSSSSPELVDQAETLVLKTILREKLGPHSLVVEIGSNDGYLLQHYQKKKIPVLGVEPGKGPAERAIARDIPTFETFFDKKAAHMILDIEGPADVIHANNVLAHVPDPNGFVAGMARLLKRNGLAIVEVQSLRALLDGVEFDQIYHEHASYFSQGALYRLFEAHGLFISGIERLATHGGSMRVFLRRQDYKKMSTRLTIQEQPEKWREQLERFASQIKDRCEWLRKAVSARKVVGFGAAAKATMLIHAAHIDHRIEAIADDNPLKQGKYIPGTAIPIISPDALPGEAHLLIFSWNYAEAVMARFPGYQGRFIIPMPVPRIL